MGGPKLWRVDSENIVDEAVLASKLGYAPDAVIVVQRGATDLISGANLKAAYLRACDLRPGDNDLAADNRAVVIAFGNYDFGAVALDLDTEFVDLIGEGVCRCDRGPAISWTGAPYASAVSAINLANAIFHWPDSHLICDTDEEVVNVTCRDILIKGFLIEQETAGKGGLRIDNADACDRGRFIDLGFKMAAVTDNAILEGTETEIASYFENCHTQARLLASCTTLSGSYKTCTGGDYSFAGEDRPGGAVASGTFIDCIGRYRSFGGNNGTVSGTFIDCIGGDDGFGGNFGTVSGTFIDCIGGDYSFGGDGTISGTFIDCIGGDISFGYSASTPTVLMQRCKSLGRSDAIKVWQGTMIDCEIEVTTAGKDAVELKANLLGDGTETADASSTTTNINIVDKDVTANFPVGSFVKHVGQGTWHRITASVFSDPDTDLTVSPAAGADWDAEEVRAQTAPRIINCRLIATAEAIDTDAETPVIVKGLVSDQSWDVVNCINMANIYDQVFWNDVRVAGLAVTLGATAPDLEVFRDALKLYAFAGAGPVEEVHFTIQLPHAYKEGTDLVPHVHWSHKIAAPGNNLGVSWKLEYSWANQGAVFGASATIEAAEEWTDAPPAQYESVYTAFPAISGVGKTISSQLICRLYRDSADAQDDFEEDVMFVEFDLHFQKDSPGSKQELIK